MIKLIDEMKQAYLKVAGGSEKWYNLWQFTSSTGLEKIKEYAHKEYIY